MSDQEVDQGKRRFLLVATGVVGGVAAVAAAVPFVASMLPSERAKAAGAPVEADICQARAGRNDGRRMARQAGVDRAPHARKCSTRIKKSDSQGRRSESQASPQQPDVREERIPFDQARYLRCSSASAPIWAARRRPSRSMPRAIMGRTGTAAFSAPATVRSSISPAACLQVPRRRTISKCRRTRFVGDAKIVIGDDSKGA